jgi:hypothetical protein
VQRSRWVVVQPALKAKALWGTFADASLAKQVDADAAVTAVGAAWAVIVAKRDAGTNYRLNTGTTKYQWVSEDDWKLVKAAWLDNTIAGLGAEDWKARKDRFTAHWYTDAGHRRDEYNAYELPTGELHYGVPSDNWHLNFHIRVPVTATEIARVTPPPPPPPPPAAVAVVAGNDAWDD